MGLIRVLLISSCIAVLWTCPALAELDQIDFNPPYTVNENTAVPHTIVTIRVTDSDEGNVSYSLDSVTDDTGANSSSCIIMDGAVLKTATMFDFEGGVDYYVVNITASTTTVNTSALRISFHVDIGDVDEPFVCDPNTYTKNMEAGATKGTKVQELKCDDPDADDADVTYIYDITGGNTGTYYSVDNVTGIIYVSKVLEAGTQHALDVTVTSSKDETDDVTVNIKVEDNGAVGLAKHLYIVTGLFVFMTKLFSTNY